MSKSAKKRSSGPRRAASVTKVPLQRDAAASQTAKADSGSKQSRVIALLRSRAGATIAAMMKATNWQQHSVRGFLAGVVRKRLKLKLDSAKVDGTRVYRIASENADKARARQPTRRSR